MTAQKFTRLAAAATVGALALTACGGDGPEGTADDPIELRFAWWGSDHRAQATEAIIEDFEEEYPHIRIEGEFNDWSGYTDQLATQMAGGEGPDVVQLDDEFISEYADRGSLLELTEVDTSAMDETVVEGGQSDGVQYGIPTGVNALVMMANPDLFEEAGVEIPDDQTWTWEDFEEVAETIHEETGAYGTNNPILQALRVWARQHDGHLFTEEGDFGLDADEVEEWFEYLLELIEIGALPSASEMSEEDSAVMEDSLIGTNRAALGMSWTNQLPAFSEASGTDLVPLRFPSHTGNAEDNGLWFKNTMLLGGNAGTDHPNEVQEFIDYFVNAEEAGIHNQMDRGLPINEDVRAAVIDEVEGQDLAAAELVEDLDGEITESEPLLPAGYTGISDAYVNSLQEVAFERQTPREAAEALVSEADSVLSREG